MFEILFKEIKTRIWDSIKVSEIIKKYLFINKTNIHSNQVQQDLLVIKKTLFNLNIFLKISKQTKW